MHHKGAQQCTYSRLDACRQHEAQHALLSPPVPAVNLPLLDLLFATDS